MKQTTHEEQMQFLKKIEGQVVGVQRMIEQKRYCVDILTQIRSIIGCCTGSKAKFSKSIWTAALRVRLREHLKPKNRKK